MLSSPGQPRVVKVELRQSSVGVVMSALKKV